MAHHGGGLHWKHMVGGALAVAGGVFAYYFITGLFPAARGEAVAATVSGAFTPKAAA